MPSGADMEGVCGVATPSLPLGLLTESVISDAQNLPDQCQTTHSKLEAATTLQPPQTVTVYVYTPSGREGGLGQLTALSQYL